MKKNNNVYKPRFKVAFQAKSKVWAYKNSHLRHFFSIRGRRLYRDGFFRKNVLVATTLKWTVARRFIKPYSRRIRARRGNSGYRSAFYLKQQLRHFYGKLTETAFRNIYKTHLLSTLDRNKSFFGALEQRADMFLFRMRLLPTIYACNQFIHHQGLVINSKRIEKCPSALIKIGDTISLPKMYWKALSKYMIYRVHFRVYGKIRLKKRLRKIFQKKVIWLTTRKFKRRSLNYWRLRLHVIKMITFFWKFFHILSKLFCKLTKLHGSKTYKGYSRVITNIYAELLAYKDNLPTTLRTFILNYKFFWRNIKKYDLKNFINKKYAKKKILKNSPRLFILILIQNYKLTRDFKYTASYFMERMALLEILFALEDLDKTHSYKYFVTKYNLDTRKLFPSTVFIKDKNISDDDDDEAEKESKKIIPLDILIPYLREQWTITLKEYMSLIKKHHLVRDKIKAMYLHLYLRSIIKKYIRRWKRYYNKTKQKQMLKLRPLVYSLINHKYKKRRKRYISRFKKVHWYIPKYIYFDARTLRGTLLYVPRAKEIVYPFKCSLFKIFSFYKSLGV